MTRSEATAIAIQAAADLVFLLAWLAAGIVLAIWNDSAVVLNTDSSAPITQLLLLAQGRVASLQELRLARIPSFFPDLLILRAGIQGMAGREAIDGLQAGYAIVMASLLMGVQGALIGLTTSLSRWRTQLFTVLGTFVLIQVSPLYREAVGLTLTPVHHGGNVINTLLALVLLAVIVRSASTLRSRIAVSALVALVLVGTLSNVLMLFTAVAPVCIALTLVLLRSSPWSGGGGDRTDHVPNWLRTRGRTIQVSLLAAALLGVIAARAFNLQCTLSLSVFPASNLLAEYRGSPVVLLATALGLILLLRAVISHHRTRQAVVVGVASPDPAQGPVALAVALSALSPYAYTWFLPDTPRRYFLSLPFLLLVMIAMLASAATARQWRGTATASPLAKARRIRSLGAFMAILCALPIAYAMLKVSSSALAARFQLRYDSGDRVMLERLASLGHHRGLSDFWGAHLTVISRGSVEVQPINKDGEPDLWAHNREAFLVEPSQANEAILPARIVDFSFVYLRVDKEEPSLIEAKDVLAAYGPPSGRLGCSKDGSGPCVLLYGDSSRLRDVLGGKLSTFRNRCRDGNVL
ncbi:hypothetical protein [Synechococcus sp. WH 5701]|uniref:hypothetical protein n=2 Tax=Synechococcus TaxID=1129 RepID=UPI0000698629|nr:hypothetical protein [Synechococcus sp. WH 5701]EAQ75525.1 hypothetical protein WH5701_01715 [Synechococcus sp. WH 5701]